MSNGLEMKYFVLKPMGADAYAQASRNALLSYATSIENENPQLAKDLKEWYNKVQPRDEEGFPIFTCGGPYHEHP